MVIRIKIMTGYTLLIVNLALLGWLVWHLKAEGMVWFVGIGTVEMILWAMTDKDTPEKKKRRETALVRSNGEIYCNGKRISLKEARKRGLKLEYEDEPKQKKPNYWNGR